MTVERLEQEMSSIEFYEWSIYDRVVASEIEAFETHQRTKGVT